MGFSDEQIYWKDLINSLELTIVTMYSKIKLVLYYKNIVIYHPFLKT